MTDDPLAKWRRPGSKPVQLKESDGVVAVAPLSGIRPREYKAFVADAGRVPLLLLKCGLVKKAEPDIALPYTSITKVTSDGYGFVFGVIYSLPFPVGAISVTFRGEGMAPLVDAIISGTVRSVQLFDPDRFLSPKEGDFDIEADEWRGPCVVRDIAVLEQGDPLLNTKKH
jgi:hypothetical protein